MQKQDQQYIPGLDSMALPRDEEVDAVSAEYLRREEEFNEIDWTRRLYAKGSDALAREARNTQTYEHSTDLLEHALPGAEERNWLQHVPSHVKEAMVRQQLAREFNLDTEKQAKPIVRAEDEYALLQTLWSSPSFTLDHERLRVQLALIAQLAGITGNRPGALLALRYSDLKITLFRDPHRVDTPNITLEFTFRQTKSYRGPKDPNTFAVPEICNDSCLPCCPQVVLLGLLFADNAFASERLTGPDKLSSLRVPKNLHQLSIPIKESLAAVPIFRAVTQNASGYMISPTAQATANWLRQQFKRWGEGTGFELPLKPYGFRRGHGEALDSSAHISDAQRNLVMGHATSGVFERNYLSRYVTQDTQAVYRGLDPQTTVIRLASGMMRSIDVRQPTNLSAKQRDEVDQQLELRLLQRTCRSLAAQIRAAYGSIKKANGTKLHLTYQALRKQHHRERKTAQRAYLRGIKKDFRKHQALADIEQQLDTSQPDQSDNEFGADVEDPVAQSLVRLSTERRLVYNLHHRRRPTG
ncbi:hypothetical protein LTS12_026303 [Elasticomyces elasticus]|nr:hypothetical protein LTS12_026303 [Elasticomyces elasticus]